MSFRRGRGVVALLMSLAAVGVIRSAIPDEIPREFEVGADSSGIARTDDVTIKFLGMETAPSVRPAGDFSDDRFVASPGTVLVLSRVSMTAHGGPFYVRTQVRTTDGYAYEAVSVGGVIRVAVAEVGTTVTSTFVYEVPKDKVGGKIAIHGLRRDGLQPVFPTIVHELPADLMLDPGEVTVLDIETVVAE